MSEALESALLIRLNPVVEWGSALEPGAALRSVTVTDPFDALAFQQRDRELAFRDLVNAAAVVDASIEISSVWNAPALRPILQGVTVSDLVTASGDLARVSNAVVPNGQVVHVKSVNTPDRAIAVDRELATRDAVIYEALAKACEVFYDPPVVTASSGAVPSLVWSLGQGVAVNADINMALPLDKHLFMQPDMNLADRDNQMAAYVAQIAKVLRNPFEFANRLYVKVETVAHATEGDGLDLRELEVYTLAEPRFEPGAAYAAGSEVLYQGVYYRARRSTTIFPVAGADWDAGNFPTNPTGIVPTKRTWLAEPVLSDRNRIIYDKTFKTLQWMRESTMQLHVPQIHALSVPGVLGYQRLTTEARIPEVKDALFWRRKAARIIHGTTEWHPAANQFSTATGGRTGTTQLDCASLLSPSQNEASQRLQVKLGGAVVGGVRYRVTALVRPSSTVEIAGGTTSSVQTFAVTAGNASAGVATLTLSDGPLGVSGYPTPPRITVSQSLSQVYRGTHLALSSVDVAPYTVSFSTTDTASSASMSGTVTCPMLPLVNGGVNFLRQFLRPTPGRESLPMEWQVVLPVGTWVMTVQYTNLSGSTDGFGIKATVETGRTALPGTVTPLSDDTVPWNFLDVDGAPLANGTLVTSSQIQIVSDGTNQIVQLRWTYGEGALHVRSLKFVQVGAATSRYSLLARLVDTDGSYLSPFTQVSTHDTLGADGILERLSFEFDCAIGSATPCLGLAWLTTGTYSGSVFLPDPQIPLQVRQVALEKRVAVVPTPGAYGFTGWRDEMLNRAMQCVVQAYAERAALFPMEEFTTTELTQGETSTLVGGATSLERYPLRAGTVEVTVGSATATDDGKGALRASGAITGGTVNYLTGAITVAGVSATAAVSVDYAFFGEWTPEVFHAWIGFMEPATRTPIKPVPPSTTWTHSLPRLLDIAAEGRAGALLRATPAHVGRPAVVPSGLRMVNGKPSAGGTVGTAWPTLTLLQPWMVEAGAYAFHSDFWSPETISN